MRGDQNGLRKMCKTGPGKYKHSVEQNAANNVRRYVKRLKQKMDRLEKENQVLHTANNAFTKSLVVNNPNVLRYCDPKVLGREIDSVALQTFSPLAITVARMNQETTNLSFTSIEAMRGIQPTKVKRQVKLIPARASLQRFERSVSLGGEVISKPEISQDLDFVTLNNTSIVEAVLTESVWPSVRVADYSSDVELEKAVRALPAFQVDATADGAKLTASKGMVIHALKYISPEIVSKLVDSSALQSKYISRPTSPEIPTSAVPILLPNNNAYK